MAGNEAARQDLHDGFVAIIGACLSPISISLFPPELIAQEPLLDRAAARLLHLVRTPQRFEIVSFATWRNCCGRATCWYETTLEPRHAAGTSVRRSSRSH